MVTSAVTSLIVTTLFMYGTSKVLWERILSLLKDHSYWSNMTEEVTKYIQNYRRCICFKVKLERASPNPIDVTYSLELVHMDYLTTELGKEDKDFNILVVMDHFNCYTEAYTTLSQTAVVVARTLLENLEVSWYSLEQYIGCIIRQAFKFSIIQPMYCSREYQLTSRFNQQDEKSTSNCWKSSSSITGYLKRSLLTRVEILRLVRLKNCAI